MRSTACLLVPSLIHEMASVTASKEASSSGYPYTPVAIDGKAIDLNSCRAIVLSELQ